MARARALEAWHVNHRGLAKRPDPALARWCVEQDFVLVTNNARDFHRIYASLDLHPGLVILLPSVERLDQMTLFERAVDAVVSMPDALNKLIEVTADGTVCISDWPTLP